MKMLDIDLPKKIIIGEKALSKVGKLCEDLNLSGAATVFSGVNVIKIFGKDISNALESHGYKTNLIILPEKIEMKSLMNLNSGFIVGVGGGRVIDAAKIAAKRNNMPFISVPTAISHDGIASNRAVINDIYSIPAVMPSGIAIDTDIIINSPYRLTASGCGDMIAKLTAVADWELSHEKTGEYISEYAAAINKTSADLIIKSAKSIRNLEIKGLRNLIEALIFSGISMSIADSSRPASGSEHLFSHALKNLYSDKASLHGEDCGVGTILCSYFHDMNWQKIVKALKTIGAPTNNEELKIPKKIIIEALSKAKNIRTDRYTILNYKDIDEKKAEEAAKETGVIQ